MNTAKQDAWPWDWVGTLQDDARWRHYLENNDLLSLPQRLEDFPSFYAARREILLARLRGLLGVHTV